MTAPLFRTRLVPSRSLRPTPLPDSARMSRAKNRSRAAAPSGADLTLQGTSGRISVAAPGRMKPRCPAAAAHFIRACRLRHICSKTSGADMILTVSHISKSFSEVPVIRDGSFFLEEVFLPRFHTKTVQLVMCQVSLPTWLVSSCFHLYLYRTFVLVSTFDQIPFCFLYRISYCFFL